MSTGLELMVINAPKKKVKLNRIQIFILYFFIFAFLGWLMETLYAIYNLKEVFYMVLFVLSMVLVP